MMVDLSLFRIGFRERFLGKMLPDGRVTVPRIVIVTLQQRLPDLKSSFIDVTLEPV